MDALRFARVAVYGAVAALGFSVAPIGAQAATQAWMDLSGAPAPTTGESGPNSNWIQLSSFSYGVAHGTTPGVSGASGAGKVPVGVHALNVTLSNMMDATNLMKAVTSGSYIPAVEIAIYKSVSTGLVPVFNIKLKNVAVTSEKWSHSAADTPSVTVSLVAQSEEFSVTKSPKSDDPKAPVNWNITPPMADLSTPP